MWISWKLFIKKDMHTIKQTLLDCKWILLASRTMASNVANDATILLNKCLVLVSLFSSNPCEYIRRIDCNQ
jgi:hypothetical protein